MPLQIINNLLNVLDFNLGALYTFGVFIPLITSVFIMITGHKFRKEYSMMLATFGMLTSMSIFFILFYNVGLLGNIQTYSLGLWMQFSNFIINWGFLFDSLSSIMFLVVSIVSSLVHIYSCSYMFYDPKVSRFMAYISFFTFFMFILVSADNFILLFLGWEGVGLCSYLLINFWFTRIQANKAAIKAMLMNRVGDLGLLFGILSIFYNFGSLEFSIVFALAPYFVGKNFILLGTSFDILSAIAFFLFIGAVGKSAQVGLHTWLPDAMEGPTPVSALIHAATMVTAGVFLIIRCSSIFEYAPTILSFIALIGATTCFFAASVGLVQNDMKKIIAYSTCSQLGYMIFSCGLSAYTVSLFHLFNHAFFKALLFLAAGSVIHGLSNEQDLRKMGGLVQTMPLTYAAVLIGSLAIMGFPFLSGFYSKDVILEVAYAKYSLVGTYSHWLGTVAATFTAFYSFRLVYWVFLSPVRAYKSYIKKVHELSILMAIPLVVLSFLSIFSGYLFKDLFIGLGSNFFKAAIFIHKNNYSFIDAEFIPFYVKIAPVYLSIESALLSIYYSKNSNKLLTYWQQYKYLDIYEFLINKWHFDTIYNFYINSKVLRFSYNCCFKLLDKGLLEVLGPKNIVLGLNKVLFSLNKQKQESLIYSQITILFCYVIIIIVWINIISFI